jgi:hypothetical protein
VKGHFSRNPCVCGSLMIWPARPLVGDLMTRKRGQKASKARSPKTLRQKGDWRELEKLFGRIQKLLQPQGTSVEWNSKIPDPVTGEQRQVDVLIKTAEGLRISVECRDRSAAQSVMWIEELAGRKISLGLDGMIAVSARGFSAPAIKKARHFGILLYDLKRLHGRRDRHLGPARGR